MGATINELTKYYQKLFTLGSLKDNIIRYVFSYALTLLFLVSLTLVKKDVLGALPILVVSPSSIICDYYVMRRGERDSKLFNLRRILAINTITNILILLGIIVFTPVILFFNGMLYPLSFIVGVVMGYKLIVLYSTSRSDLSFIIMDITLPSLFFVVLDVIILLFVGVENITGIKIMLEVFEAMAFGPLIAGVFLFLIDRSVRGLGPYPVYEYLKGYIDSWVLDDPSYLDKLLSEYAIDIQLKTDLIIFPDTYEEASLLLFPYFHFGPFRNTGSSKFPAVAGEYYYINNRLRAVVFHTPATHDLDLSDNQEMFNILKQLSDLKSPTIFTTISDIHSVKYGRAVAYLIKLEKSALLILETEEMEDIPYAIVKEMKKIGRELAYKHVVVVDAHNALRKEKYELPEEVIKEVLAVGRKALQEGLEVDVMPFKMAVVKVNVPNLTPKTGLGGNGISLVLWETFNGYNAIICIDSNNLSPALRESLKQHLKKAFNAKVVITTTDTHEVTALQLNRRGYVIIGENKREIADVIEAVEKAFYKGIETLKETEGLIYEKNIKGRVLGMNTLERMREMITVSYGRMKKLLYNFILPLSIVHIIAIYAYYIITL